jgi:hypothetical protein
MFGTGMVYAQEDYKDFDTGDRLGTWALNAWVFPGLGSYVLMKDWVGGSIQLGAGIAGDILTIMGILEMYRSIGFLDDNYRMNSNFASSERDSEKEEDLYNQAVFERGLKFIIIGSVIISASGIFNIIRAATYHKPLPELAIFKPESWNIVILPGNDGNIEKVQLSYTIRY